MVSWRTTGPRGCRRVPRCCWCRGLPVDDRDAAPLSLLPLAGEGLDEGLLLLPLSCSVPDSKRERVSSWLQSAAVKPLGLNLRALGFQRPGYGAHLLHIAVERVDEAFRDQPVIDILPALFAGDQTCILQYTEMLRDGRLRHFEPACNLACAQFRM